MALVLVMVSRQISSAYSSPHSQIGYDNGEERRPVSRCETWREAASDSWLPSARAEYRGSAPFVKNSAGWSGIRLGRREEWTEGFLRRKRTGKRNRLKNATVSVLRWNLAGPNGANSDRSIQRISTPTQQYTAD